MRPFIVCILALAIACGGGNGGSSAPPSNPPSNPPASPPSAPTGLTATGGNGQIALAWSKVSDATSYLVFRADTSGGARLQIGAPTTPDFVDGGLPSGKAAFYVVRAVGAGGTSADSAEASATTAVEPRPLNLVASAGVGQISLTWDPVPQATAYVVLRSDVRGGTKTQLASPTTSSYTDAGLGAGIAAFYVVRAIGPAGTSDDSIEVSAVTAAEPAPTGVVAVGGDAQIALSWVGLPDATGYLVFGAEAAGGPRVQLGAPSTPAFVETGLASGTLRFYVVRAVGASGTSAESAEVSARTSVQPVPQGLSASAGNATVSLSWSALAGASYRVSRSTGAGPAAQIGTAISNSFVDATAQNGVNYQYAVSSVGPAGVSAPSSAVSAEPFRELCVTDSTLNQVLTFNAERPAGTLPSRSFGSRTGLSSFGIGVDPVHGEIFSANLGIQTVTAHLESQNGNVAPLRTIATSFPAGIAYDPTDDAVIVASNSGIQTFARTAAEAAAPVRFIGIFGIERIALTGPDHGDWMFAGGNGFVRAFHRTDSGNPAPPAAELAILNGIEDLAYDPVSNQLLVANIDGVTAYSISSDGSLTPARTLRTNVVGVSATGIAVDAAAGVLYVANFGASVVTFPLDFPDNPPINPTTVLSGPLTGISFANNEIAFDSVHHAIIVQSARRILVFDAAATGNTQPLSQISADDTGIDNPGGIAFDKASSHLMVVNQNGGFTLDTYDRTATGDAAALSSLAVASGNDTFFNFTGAAFDAQTNQIVLALPEPPEVAFYARDAGGAAAAPIRTIPVNGFMPLPEAVAIDSRSGVTVVTDRGASVLTYGPSDNFGPATFINGDQTGLSSPSGVFVDEVHGEIVVADFRSILVFKLTDQGNVAPVRALNLPDGGGEDVIVDPATDEMFVLSAFGIEVYARTATGNDAPVRSLVPNGSGQLFNATRMTVCN